MLLFLLFAPLSYGVATSEIGFTCITEESTIRIDAMGEGEWRYRSWTREQSTRAEPSLVLLHGKRGYSGTGPCTHPTYSFVHDGLNYEVEPFGCTSGEEPIKAVGTFAIKQQDESLKTLWCFKL